MPENALDASSDGVGELSTAMTEGGDALALWAIDQINSARPAVGKWRKQAREADRFNAGRHFRKADEEKLTSEDRPSASINAAQKWMRFVSGVERQEMVEAVFVPRDPHDDKGAKSGSLVTKCLRYVLDRCHGDDERSRAFEDSIRRGMGWTDVVFDRSVDLEGNIDLKRIDGHEMLWDDSARQENLADVRWIARERQIHKSDLLKRHPKFRSVILQNVGQPNADDKPGTSTLINEKSAVPVESSEWPAVKPNHVRVIEFQWYDEVVGVYFANPMTDKDDWLDEESFERFKRQYSKALPRLKRHKPELEEDIEEDRLVMRSYRRMVIIGNTVVVGPQELPGKRFTFNCVTGQWDDEQELWYGYMRLLLDPQRYLTKFANQVMEIIARSGKGGVVAEEGTFVQPSDVERDWSRSGAIVYTAEGKFDKWKEKTQPELPAASMQMFSTCMQMLREVTGVNPEVSMGAGAGDQPAITMRQRQQATLTLLAREFASLHRYRVAEAKTIFAFLPFIADERWVRVGGPYESEAIQILHDPFGLDYDVVFDEGTRDPNARQEIWSSIERLAPTLIRTNNFIPELLDYLPWPARDRFALKTAMQQQAASKRKMAAEGISDGGRGKPTSLAEVKARTAKIQADTMLAQAKALAATETIKTNRARMLLEGYIKTLEQHREQEVAQQQQAQQAMAGVQGQPSAPPAGLEGLFGGPATGGGPSQ